MRDKPFEITWQITKRCNMNCRHCSAKDPSGANGKELSTEEILDVVCDQMVSLNVERVRITGGEPLCRTDLFDTVHRLISSEIKVSLISNAWNIDERISKKLKELGVSDVSISLDGLESAHDNIRRPGSYLKVMSAVKALKKAEVPVSFITTLSKLNVEQLPYLHNEIQKLDINYWQIQYASPVGNLAMQESVIIDRSDVEKILYFLVRSKMAGGINIKVACSLRYVIHDYVRSLSINNNNLPYQKMWVDIADNLWNGCSRGKTTFSILSDGKIAGCVGMSYMCETEGNIKEISLKDVWNNDLSFSTFKKDRPPCFSKLVTRA